MLKLKKRNSSQSILFISSILFLTSCSTFNKSGKGSEVLTPEAIAVHSGEIESFRASEKDQPEMVVKEFDDIPEEVQPYVQKWLNYFQGKGREHMERYLARSTRYERLMKRILRENEIPEDLIYIALIESGFSPRAISRSRAVGYWQFIRGTGKRYGLAIDTFVDERRDPVLATQAASDYFKGLYSEFNSWFLSMASYNVGEGRVRREINRLKTKDFWVLAKKHRLPKETINYVPKFLAARLIARKPEAYGFKDIPFEPPIEFETIHFDQSINMKLLADKLNVDYAELKRLNPKYRGEVAPLTSNKLELRLPLNMKELALASVKEVGVKDLVFVPDRGETDVYKVRRGDTLASIASRFKTNVAFLREINDFKKRSRLRPGRTIFVPIPSVAMPKVMLAKVDSSKKEKVEKNSDETLYVVQEGESLAEIAVKNNMTMEELMELNSFTEGQVLSLGMHLKVKKILPEAGEPSFEDLPSSQDSTVAANKKSPKTKETATSMAAATLVNNAEASSSMKTEGVDSKNPSGSTDEKNQKETAESKKQTDEKNESNSVAKNSDKSVNEESKNEKQDQLDKQEIPLGVTAIKKDLVESKDVPLKKDEKTSKDKVAKTDEAKSDKEKTAKNLTDSSTKDILKEVQGDTKELIHKVQPGESLFKIAQLYNTSISAIKKANNIKRRRVLRAGTVLKIPNSSERRTTDSSYNQWKVKKNVDVKKMSHNAKSEGNSRKKLARNSKTRI